jgi:hypothetical protein
MGGAGGSVGPMCVGPVTSPQQAGSDHTHVLTITAAQVNAGTTDYQVSLVNGHRHVVTLVTADFAVLRAGGAITKTSTTNSGHSHQYRIECTGS